MNSLLNICFNLRFVSLGQCIVGDYKTANAYIIYIGISVSDFAKGIQLMQTEKFYAKYVKISLCRWMIMKMG